jgi:hypothetical protein
VGLVESDPDARRAYGSRACQQSLAALRAQGVAGVALTCAFLADPGRAAPPRSAGPLQPREGDLALFATAVQAQHQGLRVSLQPSVLASEAGTYAFHWAPVTEDGWRAAFEAHARAVEHAALLANLAGVEWLSVGSALRAVSGAQPEGRRARSEEAAWKRDGWRAVVRGARAAFPGLLTYAAADLEEAAKVGFWGGLDAVGYELFPRLVAGAAPRAEMEERLRTTLAELARVAAAQRKPLVLTQAGFSPALQRGGRGAASGEWAAIQVALLQDALAAGPARVAAAFLWRAGTDPADAGVNARDYVLSGPERTAALRAWSASASSWFTAASPSGPGSPR